jgi:hypothetical protein
MRPSVALSEWSQSSIEKLSDPYAEFLALKSLTAPATGLQTIPKLPAALKPFQHAIVSWALRRGRAALFESTGLGKTLQYLAWGRAVADHEQGPVLILNPLAVAQQTVGEAEKFGINGVSYTAYQTAVAGDLVVTNYERFDRFDMRNFAGIVMDESAIIRNQDGAYRKLLTEACSATRWKLCCTATPAPNDYAELGQHAEFLGVMSAKEMLAMFFVHDGGVRAGQDSEANGDGWRLKRHARADFWRWLASWSVMIRTPQDLGFDGSEYELPPLRYHQVTVPAEYAPTAGMLFPVEASTLSERIAVRRETAGARVKAAVDIVLREPSEPWLIWAHLNKEADAIESALDKCLQVKGTHPVEIKVARLLGFKDGKPLWFCSKPSVAAHGMNYQHCARVLFVGLSDSFEQLFQAIRRCWRFGQTRPVEVYMVASELEGAVVANLQRKERDFEAMLDAMAGHMRDLMRENVLRGRNAVSSYNPTVEMRLPEWL